VVAEYIIITIVAFLIGLLLRPTTMTTAKSVISTLKLLERKGWKLLVRPNGQIAGVIEREEEFFDESLEMQRKRFVFYDMDGKLNKEEKDIFNKMTNSLESVVPIEHNGGIALTKKGSKLTEIFVGNVFKNYKELEDMVIALKDEMNRREKQHKTELENYKSLQFRFNDLLRKSERLEGQMIELRRSNDALVDLNERLRARTMAAEARVQMLLGELKLFKDRHGDLAEEIDEILQKARERHRKEIAIGAVTSPIPAPVPQTKPPQPEEKPEKKEEEGK